MADNKLYNILQSKEMNYNSIAEARQQFPGGDVVQRAASPVYSQNYLADHANPDYQSYQRHQQEEEKQNVFQKGWNAAKDFFTSGKPVDKAPDYKTPNYVKSQTLSSKGTGFGTGNFAAGTDWQYSKDNKTKEENLITEEQASGKEPLTPRSRKYEGTGQKAQNPEKAAAKEAEISKAKEALETAKTNLAYVTDETSEAEARKALNKAQEAYDKAVGKHVVSDEERVGLVGKGAVKGWAGDVVNAAATTAAGLNQLGEKLGGDTGEYAGWATDEVSRAAIPKQDNPEYWENQRKEVEDIQAAGDRLAASSQADIQKAKEDTRGITKFAVDIGSNAIQMGMDGLAAVLTGGTALAALGARSMGGAAREARNDGASIAQQVAYGVVRGGIELATEKMFDGLAGIYGKGGADDIVESVIGKMAKSDLGRTALRGLFSGVGEAVEEGISGVTEPLTQAIYKGISSIPKGYNKEQASEVLYSMLVGFAMGSAGSAVNVISGGNAQANADLRAAEYEGKHAAPAVEQNTAPAVEAVPEAPVVPKNGRNYEGTGKKAQNPETAARQAAQAEQAEQAESPAPEAPAPATPQGGQTAQPAGQAPAAPVPGPAPQPTQGGSNTQNNQQSNAGGSTPPPSGNNGYNWTGDEVQTQSTFHDQLTDEEKTRDELNPDNDTHIQHHDTEVDTFAEDRIANKGHDGARTDLMSRDPAEWDDVDVRTAQMLLEEELENARQLTGQAQDDAYKRIAELKNAYNKQGTEAGRSLRQRQRFGGSKTEIVSEAANILYGEENQGKTRKLSPEQKSAIMQQVDEFSTELEDIKKAMGVAPESTTETAAEATEAVAPEEAPAESADDTQSNPNVNPPAYNPANTPANNPNAPQNNPANNPQNNPNNPNSPNNNPNNTPANNPTAPANAPTNTPTKPTMSLKDLIMQVAKLRKTNGFLDFGQAKLGKIIDLVSNMDGGNDFLVQLATTQIRSIASDQIKSSFWDKAKALRYMNMLSNPATAFRNVGANTVFGSFIDAISSDLASPIDAMMSLATGKRSVAMERLSKAKLKGIAEAGLKSWLEVSLDAEAEQSSYAYNEIKGRTFKASGNFIEHILSIMERNQGYQLKTTDQLAKGGIAAETERNLLKKGVDPDTAKALAEEEAKYRTLQNESGMSKAAQGLRGALNNVLAIKGKDGKVRYGLGEDILPFAQVPANVVQTELNMNPLSVFPALGKVASVMAKGKNATVSEQRAAAKAFGQAVNGTAMVAAAAIMSAKGILRYTDDDDKDQKQLHKAQGKSGLQINFSAMGRLFSGEDPAEQDGDKWGNIGWIPQLNSLLIIGNMVYDDYKDMPEHKELADWAKLGGKVGLDSLKGIYESILEFPAVSTITSMINAAKYANVPDDATEAEKLAIQAGAVLTDKAANTLTGFTIPNVLRATAAGLDDTERNLYGADNRLGQAVDSIKAGIPDNPLIPQEYTRGSLPAQTDNFGNPIKNEGGYQQFLNKVILPGAITTDNENALYNEIDRVAMASGNADAIPDKNGAYTVTYNGEKLKLTAEEREAYHQYAGKRSEEYISRFINTSLYQMMDDDQRAETMAKLNQQAKAEANKHYLESHGYEAVDSLTDGKDKPGKSYDYAPLSKRNVPTYYAFETMMNDAIENKDYKTIDSLARKYNSYDGNLQTVLNKRDDNLRQVVKWSDSGFGSETYYAFKEATIEAQIRLDKSSRTGSSVELDALAHMNIPEAEKRRIINNVPDVGSKNVIGVYNALYDYGFDTETINNFWAMSQDWEYKDTGDREAANKQGVINPLEAAYAISKLPGLTDAQRSDIYLKIKEAANNPYAPNDWKNYSYQSEVNYIASGRAKQTWDTKSNTSNPLYYGNASNPTVPSNELAKILSGK